MLSLWKLRVGAETYYLSQVASGLDDYYSGQGESVGRWIGNTAPGLGLDGDVSGEDLRAVLAGLAPGTGLTPNGDQLRVHPRRVPGFDVTFSVPKSVSVVYALGDPLVQAAVVEAGEVAVAQTIAWLEREACHLRRGTNNRHAKLAVGETRGTRRLPGAGFVGARFRHRTSRAGDPQLHWHVLVANVTRGPDRRWSALDATGLYRSKRAAGVVFQAALRQELTVRLGVEWTPTVKDACEIAGVPQRIVRLFSKRRAEIESELERLGASGPQAAEAATLATRNPNTVIDGDGIVERWQHEADLAGWGPTQLDVLLGRGTEHGEQQRVDVEQLVGLVGDRLIEHDATFTRHQITQTIAAAIPTGAPAVELDRLTSAVLAASEIVAIREPVPPSRPPGWEQRYTTRRLIALETELSAAVASGVASETGRLPAERVAVACTVASLGVDQADAVTRLCGQGNAIEVLVGRAGTGKTYTLAAVASAYRAAGWDVVGVAPSARAARELEGGAHIASFTIPRFDHHITDRPLTATTVVILDEAGMCGTVDLHHVVTVAHHAGAKVILVGDCHQLPEVQAGGGLDAAITVLGNQVCELTVNRRQTEPWEIDALEQLRHGDVTAAWDAYLTHDRVRIADDPLVVQQTAVEDWWAAHTAGSDALLLAGTRSEARALNRHARQRALDAGTLTGASLEVAGRTFQTGDRVLLGLNDANQHTVHGEKFRVDNGMLGDIVAVNHDTATMDVRLRGGQIVRLDAGYLAAGHLDHGYAMTVHKSQGATCDTVFIVGPAGLYREAVYAALSRARRGAVLYATSRQAASIGERDHARGLPLPGDDRPADDVLHAFTQSQAKRFATHTDPHASSVADLATLDLAALTEVLHDTVTVEARVRAAGITDPKPEIAALDRAQQTRRYLDVGRRVRALDRDNVGVVTAVHDTTVRFDAEDGATATRALRWSDLKPIDRPDPVVISPQAADWFDEQAVHLEQCSRQWDEALADNGIHPGDSVLLRRAVSTRRQTVANQLSADRPAWLTWWLGPKPVDPAGAAVWDDTVAHIAAWRDQHHLNAEQPGLGPQPDNPEAAAEWLDAMTTTLRQRTWLDNHHPHPEQASIPTLTPVEIAERITELEQLFASAPPDQTRALDERTAGRVSPADLNAAVAARTERDRWILANWPYIVEHQQLRRIADQHDPLAHWPTPIRPAVQTTLDTLATALGPDSRVEERTLAKLHQALATLDPGRRLLELHQDLVAINDQLAHVQTRLDTETDPQRHALLIGEHTVLAARQADARTHVAAERRNIDNRAWQPNDTDQLHTAIVHRTNTIYRQAITEHPDWVIELLNQLDDRGTLQQLRPHQIHQLVVDAAIQHDLGPDQPTQTIRPTQPAISLAH